MPSTKDFGMGIISDQLNRLPPYMRTTIGVALMIIAILLIREIILR